jgi:putative membrane-bound dehydrogenase-like protein
VELVASEPLVESPVAIDWDAQGRLWVCEMYDYPSGLNPPADPNRKYGEPLKEPAGGFTPGGRIKILADLDGDGRYDKATVFLDRIPFPTGVTPWRQGALICAAPNILYAEDTDGDGRADVVRTNVTGFATHNYQARVNGFTWGLDGWLHGSSGLFGGKVKSLQTGKEVNLSGRDFRYRPATGEIEPVSGISQFGRVRDDFDHWFGNDNSTWLWHYPLPDHYLRRNPHVTYPEPRVLVTRGGDANRLFPISRTLERFNDQQMANIVTSGCGPDLYRDVLLGANYYGNAFICEPVHNVVHRLVLEPDGVTFAGRRAEDEQRTEFLASTDNWFRPVQVRTGPDGALYVVDMYRFVIEHPRWIPPERLKQLDVRAGANMGRIYRVLPTGGKLRPIPRFEKISGEQLVDAMKSPNGPTRDLAHRLILEPGLQPASTESGKEIVKRPDGRAPTSALAGLATNSANPAVRLQVLHALAGIREISTDTIVRALADSDSRVRRAALRLSEPLLKTATIPPELVAMLRRAVDDSALPTRLQLALTLGEWTDPLAAELLATLAAVDDRWMRGAVLSSALPHALALFDRLQADLSENPGKLSLARQLVVSAASEAASRKKLLVAAGQMGTNNAAWTLGLLGAVLDALERNRETLRDTGAGGDTTVREAAAGIGRLIAWGRRLATDAGSPDAVREVALGLLGRPGMQADSDGGSVTSDVRTLLSFLEPTVSERLQGAALGRLRRVQLPDAAALLLQDWPGRAPSQRATLLGLLVSREEWTSGLLEAIEQGRVMAAELALADRQALLKHKTASIRERANKLFVRTSDRATVLNQFHGVNALTGAMDRGASVFEKNCAQCHAMRGRGHEVGPNLAEFAGKSVQDFVLAIFDPNAGINPNFVAYNVETKDGRSLSGIVRNETASGLTLVQGGGLKETILRSDLKEIRASALSLMPEGLEQAISPQDVADLVAWLKQGTPAQFGSANSEQAAKARADFVKGSANGLAQIVTSVEALPYPSWMGRLPLAYCRQNAGQERLVWRAGPVANAGAQSMVSFRLPAAMGFMSQPAGKFTLKLNGQALLDFDVTLNDRVWEAADGRARMTYSVLEANSEDSNGVLVIEVASALVNRDVAAEFEVAGSSSNSQRWFGLYLVKESAKTASR